jgi:CH-like domain in sperm protein
MKYRSPDPNETFPAILQMAVPILLQCLNIASSHLYLSNGCLVACAEVIRYCIPRLVDIHNYSPANSVSQKLYNWNTLNRNSSVMCMFVGKSRHCFVRLRWIEKVFKKLGYCVPDDIVLAIVHNRPGFIEYVLDSTQGK